MNTNNSILELPIEELVSNKFQPRLVYDDSSLAELAESIKAHGIIQPIVVRKVDTKYEIIAGERRYRAAKIANFMKVPAILTELNEKQIAELQIVDNVHRKSLNAIEEAKSYKALLDEGLMTIKDLSQKMGVASIVLESKLKLLNLDPEVQLALLNNKISERHARSLLKLSNNEMQKKYLAQVIEERLTVKQLEDALKEVLNARGELSATKIFEKKEEYPNEFFNFLEKENVNMNFGEETVEPATEVILEKRILPVEQTSEVTEVTPIQESTPVAEVEVMAAPETEQTSVEEIEMLD
ncbi:MAG: ParB/RepB/Spo0J family partition protein [bacterium]